MAFFGKFTIFVKKKMLQLYEYMRYCCYLIVGTWDHKFHGFAGISFILQLLGVYLLLKGVGVFEDLDEWIPMIAIGVGLLWHEFWLEKDENAQKIINRYFKRRIHMNPWVALLIYVLLSVAFLCMCAMFANRHFIFEPIPPIDLLNEQAIVDCFKDCLLRI